MTKIMTLHRTPITPDQSTPPTPPEITPWPAKPLLCILVNALCWPACQLVENSLQVTFWKIHGYIQPTLHVTSSSLSSKTTVSAPTIWVFRFGIWPFTHLFTEVCKQPSQLLHILVVVKQISCNWEVQKKAPNWLSWWQPHLLRYQDKCALRNSRILFQESSCAAAWSFGLPPHRKSIPVTEFG